MTTSTPTPGRHRATSHEDTRRLHELIRAHADNDTDSGDHPSIIDPAVIVIATVVLLASMAVAIVLSSDVQPLESIIGTMTTTTATSTPTGEP